MRPFVVLAVLALHPTMTLAETVGTLAETAGGPDRGPSVRTGGMGVGTRPGDPSERPGTDIPAAGAGAGRGEPGSPRPGTAEPGAERR